jgi:hypothetical protein
MVDAARSSRLKFAREKLAHEFATEWRNRLWSEPFEHADPVHDPPSAEELTALNLVRTAPNGQGRETARLRRKSQGFTATEESVTSEFPKREHRS